MLLNTRLLIGVTLLVAANASAEDKASKYDGMAQVLVPAGEFTMGADGEDAHGRRAEFPPHRVHLSAFWIDKYEVTNGQFVQFLNKHARGNKALIYSYCDLGNPHCRIMHDGTSGECKVRKGFERHPVAAVSWQGAQAYARSVRRRLPTEAEWEKAARGADGRRYPWGNKWEPKCTNIREGGARTALPVGACPADSSPFGAMDMSGNVSEWVQDGWDESYYATSPVSNPINEENTHQRVARGGAWCLTEWDARTTSRQFLNPGTQRRYMGFRCVEPVPDPLPEAVTVSKDVLFYAPLDGYTYAAAAKGERHPMKAPKHSQYVTGRLGQAILLGDIDQPPSSIEYDASENFRVEEGTLALWIRPQGWQGTDEGFRFFFMIQDEATCKFYLYRYVEKNLLVLAGNGIEFQWGSIGMATDDWEDGQWLHLAVTWKERKFTLYVDGKLVGQTEVPKEKFFRGMPPSFHLGQFTTWSHTQKKAATAFDEFVIFSRALSSGEILRERDRSGPP